MISPRLTETLNWAKGRLPGHSPTRADLSIALELDSQERTGGDVYYLVAR